MGAGKLFSIRLLRLPSREKCISSQEPSWSFVTNFNFGLTVFECGCVIVASLFRPKNFVTDYFYLLFVVMFCEWKKGGNTGP